MYSIVTNQLSDSKPGTVASVTFQLATGCLGSENRKLFILNTRQVVATGCLIRSGMQRKGRKTAVTHTWCSCYGSNVNHIMCVRSNVRSGGNRSIQLSYGRLVIYSLHGERKQLQSQPSSDTARSTTANSSDGFGYGAVRGKPSRLRRRSFSAHGTVRS